MYFSSMKQTRTQFIQQRIRLELKYVKFLMFSDETIKSSLKKNKELQSKRRNEMIWMIWNLSRDAQNTQSGSLWRKTPEDIRKMILHEICKVWSTTSRIGKNIQQIEAVVKIIWERKMKNLQEREFKLIEQKDGKLIISPPKMKKKGKEENEEE